LYSVGTLLWARSLLLSKITQVDSRKGSKIDNIVNFKWAKVLKRLETEDYSLRLEAIEYTLPSW